MIRRVCLLLLVAYLQPETIYASQRHAVSASNELNVRVLVELRDGAELAMGAPGPMGMKVFSVPLAEVDAFLAAMRARPEVQNIAVDTPARLPKPIRVPVDFVTVQAATLLTTDRPNDPGFSSQLSWQAPRTGLEGVQNILAAYQTSGDVVRLKVGVVDSGFYSVPDLIYHSGYNFVSAGVSGSEPGPGPAFLEDDNHSLCDDPHGTAVAAIIGAEGNNGLGITGILAADVVAARSLSCGSGFLADTALAIRWLAGDDSVTRDGIPMIEEPVDLINLSLGSEGSCPFYLKEAIDYANRQGIPVIAAAGNEADDAALYSPASCAGVIVVGAVESDGSPAWFTNTGQAVDLATMGFLVTSLNQQGEISQWAGTSFATPLATGIAGLLKQTEPRLDPPQIKSLLVDTARAMAAPVFAGGVVDAGDAVGRLVTQLEARQPVVRPVLETVPDCFVDAFMDNLPQSLDFSNGFEFATDHIEPLLSGDEHVVTRQTSTGVGEVLYRGSELRFVIRDDIENELLTYNVCNRETGNCRYGEGITLSIEP